MTKHSRERALERYNIELTKLDEQEILQKIRRNEMLPLGNSDSDNHKKFAYVTYNNIPLKVLYLTTNKKGATKIITIYPFDVDEYNSLLVKDFQLKIELAIKFLKKNKYIVYKRKQK